MKPFFVTIPHSGEEVPEEAAWLKGLPEPVLMCDVDRFVDRLYAPGLDALGIPRVVARWHRYVVDLNRLPADVDRDSVEGASAPSGTHPTGYHWIRTTQGQTLMAAPMPQDLHRQLTEKYFEPFHRDVRALYARFKGEGHDQVYHLDAHSMPSKGTKAHRDPGAERPQIVVSDVDGTSCSARFKDLVIEAYSQVGFQVAYNWPYKGGRVTQTYGQPGHGQNAIQVEMNRSLYMDEATKRLVPEKAARVQEQVRKALSTIHKEL